MNVVFSHYLVTDTFPSHYIVGNQLDTGGDPPPQILGFGRIVLHWCCRKGPKKVNIVSIF